MVVEIGLAEFRSAVEAVDQREWQELAGGTLKLDFTHAGISEIPSVIARHSLNNLIRAIEARHAYDSAELHNGLKTKAFLSSVDAAAAALDVLDSPLLSGVHSEAITASYSFTEGRVWQGMKNVIVATQTTVARMQSPNEQESISQDLKDRYLPLYEMAKLIGQTGVHEIGLYAEPEIYHIGKTAAITTFASAIAVVEAGFIKNEISLPNRKVVTPRKNMRS